MENILAKIRWNIDFIKEEAGKIDGSPEIKEEILSACDVFNGAFTKCFEGDMDKQKVKEVVTPALKEFDGIIRKIEKDDNNKALFMLLITHIADIKFLLSSDEEQKRIMEWMEREKKEQEKN